MRPRQKYFTLPLLALFGCVALSGQGTLVPVAAELPPDFSTGSTIAAPSIDASDVMQHCPIS